MRNLFVCHTQAQLILASGLALGRFCKDDNQLILFVDFGISDELKQRLSKTFTRIQYLQGIYPEKFSTFRAKFKWYPKDWQQIKLFVRGQYDHVFVVCDHILLTQKLLQRLFKANPKIKMSWIEDGITAYYKDTEISGGLDSNTFTRRIRAFIFKRLFGLGRFYDRSFWYTGGLKCLEDAYVCYPDAVISQYKTKVLRAISDDEYMSGLKSMYNAASMNICDDSVILVLDKFDRYYHPELVTSFLETFINQCHSEGKTVYCKLHPRETYRWQILENSLILENSIGIESTYLSLLPRKESVIIAGLKSTGLMSAKKLGFTTISFFKTIGENNDNLIRFFESLDIQLYS